MSRSIDWLVENFNISPKNFPIFVFEYRNIKIIISFGLIGLIIDKIKIN